MTEIVREVTDDGLHLPRRLLEGCGYSEGRRMVITATPAGLLIRPAEATPAEIASLALQHLLLEVGDCAGITAPELRNGQWHVPVVLLPAALPLGHLRYDLQGTLLPDASSTPVELAEAADAA